MAELLTVGAVTFWKDGKPTFPDSPLGAERIRLLKLFYHGGNPLPDGYEARADFYHQNREITTADVDWRTASEEVTGPGGKW